MAETWRDSDILELYEEWERPIREDILRQFQKEVEIWTEYRLTGGRDNDDLFGDVAVSASLVIDGRRRKKSRAKTKTRKRRESAATTKTEQNCKSSTIPSATKKDKKNVRFASASEVDIPHEQTETPEHTGEGPPSKPKHQTKCHLILNKITKQRNSASVIDEIKRTNHETPNNDGSCRGRSMAIQKVVVPVVQKQQTPTEVAMGVVKSITWDTVRMVRRSGFSEGYSIVLVKPKGMPAAPTLLAMQNEKGDLTIPCDSLSNQRALSRILGMLNESTTGYSVNTKS